MRSRLSLWPWAVAAGCRGMPPPAASLPALLLRPTTPDTAHRVPSRSSDSITVHITLMPSFLNSIEVSLLWHFTARRPTGVTLVRARPYRFGLTRLLSGAALARPHAWLAAGKDPLNAEHTAGAGQRSLEGAAPQAQLPIPPGTRSSPAGSGSRLCPVREAVSGRQRVPQTHKPASSEEGGNRETCVNGKP